MQMPTSLTRADRDRLVQLLMSIDDERYPRSARPQGKRRFQLLEQERRLLAEYSDGLPRVVMGACPFSGTVLRRAFDPFGLNGPWWWRDQTFAINEPDAPPAFKVLLGSLMLSGRRPAEATDSVTPGPEIPFVIPRMLGLQGMCAVICQIATDVGDIAHAITYWSKRDISPRRLHQFWLRQELWFEGAHGSGWMVANDVWDFNLEPWINSGRLRWISPDDPKHRVLGADSGQSCPFVNAVGERRPQTFSRGRRDLGTAPDGRIINPFVEED